MSEDGKVIKEINEIVNRTGKIPSLIPYLCNPETHEEAKEIWQNWIKASEKILRVNRDDLGELRDRP